MIFFERSKVDRGLMKAMVGCEEWLETKEKSALYCIFWTKPNQEKAKTEPFVSFFTSIVEILLFLFVAYFLVYFLFFLFYK